MSWSCSRPGKPVPRRVRPTRRSPPPAFPPSAPSARAGYGRRRPCGLAVSQRRRAHRDAGTGAGRQRCVTRRRCSSAAPGRCRANRRFRARAGSAADVSRPSQRRTPDVAADADGGRARAPQPATSRARLVRRARSAVSRTPTRYFREAIALAPNDAVDQQRVGRSVPREAQPSRTRPSRFRPRSRPSPTTRRRNSGMAHAVADENPPAAMRYVPPRARAQPVRCGAHLFLAELAIDEDKKEEAREAIAKAQSINPNSLEAHALDSGHRFRRRQGRRLQGRYRRRPEDQSAVRRSLPRRWAVTARYYRFDEAAEQARRGIAIDRENARAHADLGVYLMRTGRRAQRATRARNRRFAPIPYDVITYNLLELLDKLDKFQTVHGRRSDHQAAPRRNRRHARVRRRPWRRRRCRPCSKRWNFTPKGPILIEVFPKHDDFAVRNVGLIGMIGALGACFGRVVTMDSPKARPPGDFNWAATLWHELAHVITLAALESADSALVERRHLRVRGNAGAAGMAPQDGPLPFARAMDAGEVLKLRRSQFRLPGSAHRSRWRTTRPRSWSSTSCRNTASGAARAGRVVCRRHRHGDRGQSRAENDLDTLQIILRCLSGRSGSRRLRRALHVPEGFTPDQPLDRLKAAAAEHPESYAVQMALGRALRSSDRAGAHRGVRAGRQAGAHDHRPRERLHADGRGGAGGGGQGARRRTHSKR